MDQNIQFAIGTVLVALISLVGIALIGLVVKLLEPVKLWIKSNAANGTLLILKQVAATAVMAVKDQGLDKKGEELLAMAVKDAVGHIEALGIDLPEAVIESACREQYQHLIKAVEDQLDSMLSITASAAPIQLPSPSPAPVPTVQS